MTYIHVGRYETKKVNPSSDVLQKIARALNTTSDYLINGSDDEMASSQLQDKELLNLLNPLNNFLVKIKI